MCQYLTQTRSKHWTELQSIAREAWMICEVQSSCRITLAQSLYSQAPYNRSCPWRWETSQRCKPLQQKALQSSIFDATSGSSPLALCVTGRTTGAHLTNSLWGHSQALGRTERVGGVCSLLPAGGRGVVELVLIHDLLLQLLLLPPQLVQLISVRRRDDNAGLGASRIGPNPTQVVKNTFPSIKKYISAVAFVNILYVLYTWLDLSCPLCFPLGISSQVLSSLTLALPFH